jgi:phosphoribosylglycinamide formyltransferase-1
MKSIVIFASGKGSNAENIIRYFKQNSTIKITLIVSNNKDAGVIKIAENNSIPTLLIDKTKLENLAMEWKEKKIDLIVLAGFLWQIPNSLIKSFSNKIINIHPSLLPKYGGKGMYGKAVYSAVLQNKEQQSGITIHFVNEQYDEGKIILQAICNIDEKETIETLAKKMAEIEHQHLPQVIEKLLQ